jgi:peptide/nickel transport system permease protein
MSIPEFWLGIIFILIFAVRLRILPAVGYTLYSGNIITFIKHLILPSVTLGSSLTAVTTRMLRANMLEVLKQDYILLARANGIRNSRILLVHTLRNALIPVVTALGMQVGYVFGGSIIIERVFNYPGLGSLLLKSLNERDYPLVQATIMVYAAVFIVVNLVVDILYAFLNPKIKQ